MMTGAPNSGVTAFRGMMPPSDGRVQKRLQRRAMAAPISIVTGNVRARARELFDDLVSMLKYALFLRKLSDVTPHAIRKHVLKAAFVPLSAFPSLQGFINVVPGFTNLKKWC